MSTTNITREEAAVRTAGLRLEAYHTTVDLRRAELRERTGFDVHCVVELESTLEETFLDFLDGTVHRLVVNGEPQAVRHDGARLALRLEPGHNIVEVEAEATFSTSGQGLHRFFDPVDGRCYLYTQFEPADARRLFPCFEQPDLKAHHHITVLAPEPWRVLSNQPRVDGGPVPAHGENPAGVRHTFAPTPLLSSYLTCIVAGEWHEERGHWSLAGDGEPLEVELATYCRQSMAPYLDADAILEVTGQGLDFFHREFGHRYPWGKYHQVFVPEYNLGAMENPGLVTFTESYLPRSAATRAQYQGRANTILHEMAHMWFGDLVTPAWWDDLWLKESFAEFMGAHASVQATEFTDAWVAFAGRRKAWAYKQDQLPTTHPIVADIGDIEAAKQNFDGITYAKGAAVLKQLVAYVGLEAFLAGSRAYFERHAFGVARLADLLDALEQASGRDLEAWSRAWLQTAGPDALGSRLELDGDRIARLAVTQHSVDARDGSPVGRPHVLKVGLYGRRQDRLERTALLDVELDGRELTEVPGAAGLPAPDLVLVNDSDLSYATVLLDERSRATVLDALGGLADPLARALCWSSLWNMTRDAELAVDDYLAAVARHGLGEGDVATLVDLLANAAEAIDHFLPAERRQEAAAAHAAALQQALAGAEPGSDRQLALSRALLRSIARLPELSGTALGLLSGEQVPAGLETGPELRWIAAQSLAANGTWQQPELDAELERDRAASSVTDHLHALAARPVPEVKEEVWERLHTPLALVNDHVDALVAGFTTPGQEELAEPFIDRYFDGLLEVWQQHAIVIASRLVAGLFPATPDAAERAEQWLDGHGEAPGALRRLVLEGADHARRARRAQQRNAG